jgi:hypothetical protein
MRSPFPWPHGVPNAFAFVLNPFHYTGDLPIELISGARLARADPPEIKIIEELRDKLGRAGESIAFRHEPIPRELRNSPTWNRILLPRSTFWIIKFDIDPEILLKFRRASQLTDNELEIGAIFPPEEQPFLPRVIFPWRMESFFDGSWRNDSQPLNVEDLRATRGLADKIHAFRDEAAGDPGKGLIVRVFDDFIELSQQTQSGHLAFLGHFALIEALLTNSGSGSRISHQIRTKMPLVMRRFRRLLNVTDHFALTNEQETWRLLYRLRNYYAHGEEADFDTPSRENGVQELKNLHEVFRFIRESLKRLLILALEETQLILDLKAC